MVQVKQFIERIDWLKPFWNFIKFLLYIDKFKNTLIIKNGSATIEVKGTYEKSDPKAMQSFLSDLVINYYECTEQKCEEVKIDFSNLNEKDEGELKPIMESIARYFNLKITY